MQVVEPFRLSEAHIVSSNVTIDDHEEWDGVTTYASGDRVYRGLSVYESLQAGNTNHDPAAPASSAWWVRVGAVNWWRPFDESLEQQSENPDLIEYVFQIPDHIDTVAIFSASGSHIEITVVDPNDVEIYSSRRDLVVVKDSPYGNWGYYFFPLVYSSFGMFADLPAYLGCKIRVRIEATGGTAKVGEIILGVNHMLGETTTGTEPGTQDFSIKERNDFGNILIVERGFVDNVTFEFAFDTIEVARIRRLLINLRARLAVYHAGGEGDSKLGLIVPGFWNDFSLPLSTNISFGTLTAESLLSYVEIT